MTPEELMSFLADRPGCCAGLRVAAESEINRLRQEVERLNAAIAENHKIIHRQNHEIETMKALVRAFRDINVDLDTKLLEREPYTISPLAYEGSVASRCRNWRGLHLAHSGELFEAAAAEIERMRLTDEEREAIATATAECESMPTTKSREAADTLRALLKRLG
jgi:hypothetical protein